MNFVATLTNDATVKTLDNGKVVVSFSLAINEHYKPQGSDKYQEHTTFIECALWNNENVAKILTKGSIIQVLKGRMESRVYQTKTGEYKSALAFTIYDFQMIKMAKTETIETAE